MGVGAFSPLPKEICTLAGSILNFRIRSVSSMGWIAATLLADAVSASQTIGRTPRGS